MDVSYPWTDKNYGCQIIITKAGEIIDSSSDDDPLSNLDESNSWTDYNFGLRNSNQISGGFKDRSYDNNPLEGHNNYGYLLK